MKPPFSNAFGEQVQETLAKTFGEMQQRTQEILAKTPLADAEKNVRAVLQQGFAKLDLVTRAEFDVQQQLLDKLRERVEVLEARVTELEKKLS